MNLLLSTLVLFAGLTQSSTGAVTSQNSYQLSTSRGSPQVVTSTVTTNEDTFLGELSLPAQVQETVLVVPTPDLSVQSLADLTEDLTVMCRIFDKAPPARRASTGFAYGDQGDVLFLPFGAQSQRTQGLYLDGYGALFFIPVNYPLVPTEQPKPTSDKPKESTDTVWSQTVKEMSGQPGEEPQPEGSAPAYDAQRVETLSKTLIKTLAHTSNIRMRRPQDVITLVVGALDDSRASSYRRYATAGRSTSAAAPMSRGAAKPQPTVRNPAGALLVMRVTKADVDAFAKGQLTAAQFTEKVQTLSAPISSGAAPAPQPAPTSPSRERR